MSKNKSKTKKTKICFLEVEAKDKKLIQEKYPSAKIFSSILSESEIIKKCKDSEILCSFIYSKISSKVINALPNLKLIITRSVGYDHIDLITAKKKNITVSNVPDYGAHVIAEHVFALLLSGLRHISEADDRVEQDKAFCFTGLRGQTLKGKTLGIIGTGKIGSNVARIASLGFLMNVLAYDVHPNQNIALENHFTYVDLASIWHKSDIITLHCPLLKSTQYLINKKSISAMKKGVIIVNTSRGGIIDTKALTQALKSEKISAAFLDVLEHENNLKKNKELIKLPNVIVTPHIAFYADDAMKKMYSESFRTINSFLKKKKVINQVQGL